jgi:hypothetical protein
MVWRDGMHIHMLAQENWSIECWSAQEKKLDDGFCFMSKKTGD